MVHFAFVDRSFDELTSPSIMQDIVRKMIRKRQRERERETHTHTEKERERERERESETGTKKEQIGDVMFYLLNAGLKACNATSQEEQPISRRISQEEGNETDVNASKLIKTSFSKYGSL